MNTIWSLTKLELEPLIFQALDNETHWQYCLPKHPYFRHYASHGMELPDNDMMKYPRLHLPTYAVFNNETEFSTGE